jgi:hypothetical protein
MNDHKNLQIRMKIEWAIDVSKYAPLDGPPRNFSKTMFFTNHYYALYMPVINTIYETEIKDKNV